ncbi:uncharacterized protein LOC143219022 isoform X2 [Lasioglossum baleicum]|uniref:uncharacterized protein LOC143219022 isoform X2 n=1 Tax=Lasioglossum baleicum TaxID=434251 RepID=UPI003FCC6110
MITVTVPGFEIVIVSTVPIKCGLGSRSALVVAIYTFLEAITNTQTMNVLEKTLICYLAQRLASGSQHHHIADSLVSIIGNEDKIIAFNSRSLTIDNYDFPVTVGAEMVLIEFPDFDLEKSSKYRLDAARRKEILVIKNTKSRWRTNPEGASTMERLFSEETVTLTEDILNEDKRISQMIQAIQTKRWKKLGRMSTIESVKQLVLSFFFHCIVLIIV